jgi:hypothetical protein
MLKHSLLFVFLLCASLVVAQPTSFSETPAEYTKQMAAFLKETKRPDCEALALALEKLNKTGGLPADQMPKITALSNTMLKMQLRAYPTFLGFVQTVLNIQKSEDGKAKFDEWMGVTEKTVAAYSRRATDINNFFSFSSDLFEHKALYWNDRPGPNWCFDKPSYSIKFKDVPYLEFNQNIELRCIRKEKDSIMIRNTSGMYYPITFTWQGKDGTCDWERAGLGKNVYATFKKYKLDCKKSNYTVDTVQLSHATYFTEPIVGKFEDNVEINAKQGNTNFPRFESFQNAFNIDNLGEGLKYYGGFKLFGSDLQGPGTAEKRAVIRIYNRVGDLVVKASSSQFAIVKGERILSEHASVSLYFGKDSIYHPDLRLRYTIPKRELGISRSEGSNSKGTFTDSYHEMDIDVEDIQWYIDSVNINVGKKTISFGSGTETECRFESNDFFSEREWVRHQNIATKNPIAELEQMTNETEREINALDYAKSFDGRFSTNTILSLIQGLTQSGFIYYDDEKEKITVKDKVKHYADSYGKNKDFDVYRIYSSINGINAKFNTADKNMYVSGAKHILISDSAMVAIEPNREKVILKKNRDLDFSGVAHAGYAFFAGKQYHLNYEEYKIKMDSIQLFQLKVPIGEYDKDGAPLIEPLKTSIEDTDGVLTIETPDNKSGTKYYRDRQKKRREGVALGEKIDRNRYVSAYPSFQSNSRSHAYYDHKTTEGGCYKRDSFYFHLDTFTFDSLHTFDPRGISFEGDLVSADIFPQFREVLRVQPDRSLGFTHKVPAEGYTTYKGKANYKGDLILDNKGMQGKGSLDYLTSNFKSDSIVFRPKSMSATAERFDVAEDRNSAVKFPKVEGTDVAINWKPYDDDMEIKSREDPFKFYGQEKYLRGTLHLTSKGIEGAGRFEWEDGIVDSRRMKFGPNNMQSDTANVGVKSSDSAQLAFSSKNVKIYSDFDNENSKFQSNSDKPVSEMPYNKYVTTFDKYDWDMKKKTIAFQMNNGQMGRFVSVASGQDSLNFKGTGGNYDLKTYKLTVEGVTFINTADALVYPKDGKVIIQKDAVMEPLLDAKIIADTLNRYHVINRASVNIQGKKNYRASGYYEYNVGSKNQEILFSDIVASQSGKNWVTKASGKVEEDDKFLVDKRTSYKGTINLSANDKNLTFDGYARMNTTLLPDPTWFSINSPIDRKNVVISYNEPHNPDNAKLYTEIRLGKRATDTGDVSILYPLIMRTPLERADRAYFTCKGAFRYFEKTDDFMFGDSVKVATDTVRGNSILYNDRNGNYQAEGKFKIGEFLQPIRADIGGIATGNMSQQEAGIQFKLVGGFKMPFIERAYTILSDDISSQVELKDIVYDQKFLRRAIPQVMDAKKSGRALESIGIGILDIPKEADYTFFFGDMPMRFNPDFQSFVCDSLGLTMLNKKSINKKIKGFLEIRNIDKGGKNFEVMHLYLEPSAGRYYYFNYEQGVVSAISNNPSFNAEIKGTKKKDLKATIKNGKQRQTVAFEMADEQKMRYFLARMNGGTMPDFTVPDGTGTPPPLDTTAQVIDVTTSGDSTAAPTVPTENRDSLEYNPSENKTAKKGKKKGKKEKEFINNAPPPMPVENPNAPPVKKGDWLKGPPKAEPKVEPKKEEPKVETPPAPPVEQPKVEEPKATPVPPPPAPPVEQPKAEEPKATPVPPPSAPPIEQPKVEEPKATPVPPPPAPPIEQPKAEEPKATPVPPPPAPPVEQPKPNTTQTANPTAPPPPPPPPSGAQPQPNTPAPPPPPPADDDAPAPDDGGN